MHTLRRAHIHSCRLSVPGPKDACQLTFYRSATETTDILVSNSGYIGTAISTPPAVACPDLVCKTAHLFRGGLTQMRRRATPLRVVLHVVCIGPVGVNLR